MPSARLVVSILNQTTWGRKMQASANFHQIKKQKNSEDILDCNNCPKSWQLTAHAQARMQQRGIPQRLLRYLELWGHRSSAGSGCLAVYFRKCDLRRIQGIIPKADYLAIEERANLYAVVRNDSAVITVGHHFRHWIRGKSSQFKLSQYTHLPT